MLEVRFLGSSRFKGHAWEEPAQGGPLFKDGVSGTHEIVLTLAKNATAFEVKLLSGATWSAKRFKCPRSAEGRLAAEFDYTRRDIFDRLTAALDPSARAAKEAAEREKFLLESLSLTASATNGGGVGKQRVVFHPSGASGAYIPPLAAAGSPFDDGALTRHQQHPRHHGKQLTVVRPSIAHAPVEWISHPFEDRYTLGKRLKRERRAHMEGYSSAALLSRKSFLPVNETVWVGRGDESAPRRDLPATLSAIDASATETELRATATAARQTHTLIPSTTAAHGSSLVRTDDGKLAVKTRPRNLAVGKLADALRRDVPFEHMPDEYVSAWEAELKTRRGGTAVRAAVEGGGGGSGGPPPFRPVGPTVAAQHGGAAAFSSERSGDPQPTTTSSTTTATGSDAPVGEASQSDAVNAKSSSRPVYLPYTKDVSDVTPVFI